MNDSDEQLITDMLASNSAEALDWLIDGSVASFRNLGEMNTEDSIGFVQHLYECGAKIVLAVKIDEYPEGQNAGHLLVQLPTNSEMRKKLFLFEREHSEIHGFDSTPDEGQEYIYLHLD